MIYLIRNYCYLLLVMVFSSSLSAQAPAYVAVHLPLTGSDVYCYGSLPNGTCSFYDNIFVAAPIISNGNQLELRVVRYPVAGNPVPLGSGFATQPNIVSGVRYTSHACSGSSASIFSGNVAQSTDIIMTYPAHTLNNLGSITLKAFLSDNAGNCGCTQPFTIRRLSTPTGLSVSAGNSSTANVSWSGDSETEEYEIEVNGVVVGTTTSTSYTVNNQTPNSQVCVRVRAWANDGATPWTSPDCTTLPSAPCSAPYNLHVDNQTFTAIGVDWSGSTSGYWEIEMFPQSGGTPITRTSSNTSVVFSNLPSNTCYSRFEVRQVCSGNTSSWVVYNGPICTQSCSTPSNFTATATSSSEIQVGNGGAALSEVRYRNSSTSTWASGGSSSGSHVLSGLQPSTCYDIQIREDCGQIQSSWSSIVQVCTPALPCVDNNEPNDNGGQATSMVPSFTGNTATVLLQACHDPSESNFDDWYSIPLPNIPTVDYEVTVSVITGTSAFLVQGHTVGGITPQTFTVSGNNPGSILLEIYPENNLASNTGDYTVQVDIVEVPNCGGFSLTATATDPFVCVGNLTDINTTITGGTSNYSYVWNTGETTVGLQQIPAGTYSVTTTDASSCTATASVIISNYPSLTVTPNIVDVSCFGEADGVISLQAVGGSGIPMYIWSNGETTSSISGLSPGVYSYTISDGNNCNSTSSIIVTEPPVLQATASVVDEQCAGGADGAIDVSVSGGQGPYNYLWNNAATTEDISGLASGSYTSTVTDANGCSVSVSEVVDPGVSVSVSLLGPTSVYRDTANHVVFTSSVTGSIFSAQHATLVSSMADEAVCDFTATPYGISEVYVQYTDPNGCIATDVIQVDVLALPFVFVSPTPINSGARVQGQILHNGVNPDPDDYILIKDMQGNLVAYSELVHYQGSYYIGGNCIVYEQNTTNSTGLVAPNDSFQMELLDISEGELISYPNPDSPTLLPWQPVTGVGYLPNTHWTDIYDFETTVYDTIVLHPGVNYVSVDVIPSDNTITYLLSLLDPANIVSYVASMDASGATIYTPGYPPFIQSLLDYSPGQGLIVECTQHDTIIIAGERISENYRVPLHQGWNFIGHFRGDEPVATFFTNLITAGNLQSINGFIPATAVSANNTTGATIYQPSNPPFMNNLLILENSGAYYVLVNQGAASYRMSNFSSVQCHLNAQLNGFGQPGDLIEVLHPSNQVVSHLEVVTNGYCRTKTFYGDHTGTNAIEGDFEPGDLIRFRYDGELLDTSIIFMPHRLHNIELSQVSMTTSTNELTESDSEISLFPNPAQSGGIISLKGDFAQKEVSIIVLNQLGQLVQQLTISSEKNVLALNAPKATGVYSIQILCEGMSTKNLKLIVK